MTAIPAVKPVVTQLAATGRVTRGWLGVTIQPLTPELAETLGLESTMKGVVVTQVEPGGPAGESGLRRGDVILEVNRKPVKDVDAYRKAVDAAGKGKSVLFLVRRGENTIFLAVKPGGG